MRALAAGSIFLAAGRKADALKQFEALAGETSKPALKAEATVRAGLVALDLAQNEKGKPDNAMTAKATALLQKGRNLPEAGRWSGIAAVGLLRLEYQSGQYQQAFADYQRSKDQVPEEVRPEMMLLAGNSQRQLGHMKEAQEIYRQIIQKYPGPRGGKRRALSAFDRPLQRQRSDPARGDRSVHQRQSRRRAQPIRRNCSKPKRSTKKRISPAPRPLYAGLRDSKLSAKLRAESAFKLGWCYVQTKQTDKAIDAFAYFLQAFPDNPQVPSALAQRALAYQEGKQYERARSDLEQLLTSFPKAREREAALQQKALILGQTGRRTKGMTATFQQLLKEYPKERGGGAGALLHRKVGFRSEGLRDRDRGDEQGAAAKQGAIRHPAALRIMSSYFYLKQRDALAKEVNKFYDSFA